MGKYSFGKSSRLKRSSDFSNILKNGGRCKGRFLSIHYLSYDDSGFSQPVFVDSSKTKVGFVVSKKVSKKAVKRNRVKRRLRNIYCMHRDHLHSGYFYVVIAASDSSEIDYKSLEWDFISTANRLGKRIVDNQQDCGS